VLARGAEAQQNTSPPLAWVKGNISHKCIKGKNHLSDITEPSKELGQNASSAEATSHHRYEVLYFFDS